MTDTNIYQAPSADIETKDFKPTRPKMVWIILIFVSFSIFGLISHLAFISGVLPMDQSVRKYYESMGIIDHIMLIVFPIYMLIAAIMLFRLKLVVVKLFWIYAIMSIFMNIYSFSKPEYREFILSQTTAMVGVGIGYIWIVFLVYYPNKLKRKGLLQP